MSLNEKEKLLYEEVTLGLSEEEDESIKKSVKNYLENNEIMTEAERLIYEYDGLENIPEDIFSESEFDTVKLFAFCRIYDERRKNPPKVN